MRVCAVPACAGCREQRSGWRRSSSSQTATGSQARGGLQQRNDLGGENIAKRVRAAPAARLLLLRRKGRVRIEPITRRLLIPALAAATGTEWLCLSVMKSLI